MPVYMFQHVRGLFLSLVMPVYVPSTFHHSVLPVYMFQHVRGLFLSLSIARVHAQHVRGLFLSLSIARMHHLREVKPFV